MGLVDKLLIFALHTIFTIYDILTLPIYTLLQAPWRRLQNAKIPRARLVGRNETEITWECTVPPSPQQEDMVTRKIDTVGKLIEFAMVRNCAREKCMGTRKVLREEEVTDKVGRTFRKWEMGDYEWLSYPQVAGRISSFGKGLKELGLVAKERLCIFAETRAEWEIAALGAMQQNIVVATIYATLGEDGVAHGLRETGCSVVLTSHDHFTKLKGILRNDMSLRQQIKAIICMEDPIRGVVNKEDKEDVALDTPIYGFRQILQMGDSSSVEPTPPSPQDVALIAYTSGSTGRPKGVLLSHSNIAHAVYSVLSFAEPIRNDDVSLGYLPLAHCAEFENELCLLVLGIPIGYSSPLTMMTGGGKLLPGCKGDVVVLRPTVFPMVPLIMDRISKAVHSTVEKKGGIAKAIFDSFYNYRLKWHQRGYQTPLLDKAFFGKIRSVVGGRVRYIPVGSAPLAPETQEFIRNCLGTTVLQAFGAAETGGVATYCRAEDNMKSGFVGVPASSTLIRLVDWKEGRYSINDKPHPRGEILIGGDSVALGYYLQSEEKNQDFFEKDGLKWFRTGDIGEIDELGMLKIVDRKKDIVKLQCGEYISLGKIESELKTSPYIDNICIYGDSTKYNCVALVVPNRAQLKELAHSLGKSDDSYSLLDDPDISQMLLTKLQEFGASCHLSKTEIPTAITLCKDEWTPETGLVTAAFKLQRRHIQDKYQREIASMYNSP